VKRELGVEYRGETKKLYDVTYGELGILVSEISRE